MRLNPVKKANETRMGSTTLLRCMETVFYSLAPIIPLWQEKENLDRQSIALKEEYDNIEKRHKQELQDWNKRKTKQDQKTYDFEQQFQAAMKEARENIQAVQGSLFESSEATFKQFIQKNVI